MTVPTPTKRPPTTVETGFVDLSYGGDYGWRIVSDCGVVKVYSTRDGCMLALNPTTARRVADEFVALVNEAADTTELRSYGKVVSREASSS
jgi:hypothetical protein